MTKESFAAPCAKDAHSLEAIVAEEIHQEIQTRRKAANLSTENTAQNLVGLSFSGGGNRSGAICLGILQGLASAKKLKYFDYLSTVSGGGYAGAYLSSLATKEAQSHTLPQTTNATLNQSGFANSKTSPAGDSETRHDDPPDLPIVPGANGKQPQRILDFLDTARRFNKPLVFFNRYLVGTLLNWLAIFSGLCTIAAGSAWLFRRIYNPDVLDVLSVLGFPDDLSVCLFPPLLIFCCWIVVWGISYWRHGSRATGGYARGLFLILLMTLGVSSAAILGAGDIDMSNWMPSTPGSNNERVNSAFATAQTIVISAVLASLIPYLNPMRLFRSGAGSAKPLEKYIFAIASRALVFGVPFLVMSFFVREDISQWYAKRDGTVYRSEIRDWKQLDPAYDSTVTPWEKSSLPLVKDEFRKSRAADMLTQQHATYFEHHSRENAAPESRLRDTRFWTRWRYLLKYAFTATGDVDSHSSKQPASQLNEIAVPSFAAFLKAKQESRNSKDALAGLLTASLKRKDFARHFLPNDLAASGALPKTRLTEVSAGETAEPTPTTTADRLAQKRFSTIAEKETWYWNLRAAELEAQRVANYQPDTEDSFSQTMHARDVLDSNRNLLQAYYGDALEPSTAVFSGVVWEHDQATRRNWFFVSLAIFLVSALLIDLNATSCHGYYATQTAECWIEKVNGFDREVQLVHLNTTDSGRPYHLINGCVRSVGRQRETSSFREQDDFLFSRLYCGSENLAYRRTTEFMDGKLTLADAIAASGGAVSPTESGNPLTGMLLILMNFRLGQWVANPGYQASMLANSKLLRRWPFTPARWLWSMLRPPKERPFCLVTDGGYYENLGIESLLRRRCKLILAIDAGQDEAHQFADFLRLVRRCRLEFDIGIEPLNQKLQRELLEDISLTDHDNNAGAFTTDSQNSPQSVRSTPSAWTKKHFAVARILYPEGTHGLLIYVKSSMNGDEPIELIQFQRMNPDFPHHPTGDHLLYNADQFLSYIQLGCHMATDVTKLLPDDLDTAPIDVIERAFCTDTESRQTSRRTDPWSSEEDCKAPSEKPLEEEMFANSSDLRAPAHWIDREIAQAIAKSNQKPASENIAYALGLSLRKKSHFLNAINKALQETNDAPTETKVLRIRQAIASELLGKAEIR